MVSEIGILQLLGSNNIVSCIEAFDDGTCAFIILELMEANLTCLLCNIKVKFDENSIKFILRETLKGLVFLHARHIIHRDIKSDNILFNFAGDIKLADFGAAAQLTS